MLLVRRQSPIVSAVGAARGYTRWFETAAGPISFAERFRDVARGAPCRKDVLLARTNYSFERRQRDLAKKKKAEEKLARKIAKSKEKHAARPPEASGVETPTPQPPDVTEEG
jgi:hypothetical protein